MRYIPQQPYSLSSLFNEVTKKNNVYCQSVATEMSKGLHEKPKMLLSQEQWGSGLQSRHTER